MRLKSLLHGLGIKPRPREFPFDVDAIVLPREGEVRLARWRHPAERRTQLTQGAVDALRAFLREGDVAIDVGAHTGDTAVPMALAVGPRGAVLALEPNPYVFKVLAANAQLNRDKTNILPLMFAATPEDGDYDFEYSDAGFCNGGRHQGIGRWTHGHFFTLRVVGRNLLRHLERERPEELTRVRYVKIDTEGFDRHVAASLRPFLAATRPYLRSEIYRHLARQERVAYYRELRELGYRVHRFEGDEHYLGVELTEDALMRWPHYDIFVVPE